MLVGSLESDHHRNARFDTLTASAILRPQFRRRHDGLGRANDFLDSQLRELIEVGTSKMLVNLTDVTQLDSASIGSIVRAFTSLKHRGASLKLLVPRGNVRLVLETVHLLDVIPSSEDETQAIASFH
jgi:anti-anti-sigma factor